MKLIAVKDGNETVYLDPVTKIKKYSHYKDSDDYEIWCEYDESGNEIHYKNSDGDECWSDSHPDNPKNKVLVVDVEPFVFNRKENT